MNPTDSKIAFKLHQLLMIALVLVAAPLNSGAATTVFHMNLSGPFAGVFSCDVNNVCSSVFVGSLSAPGAAPQWMLSYSLILPTGDQYLGFGAIPGANVSLKGAPSLTLADTDTSVLATTTGFVNLFCPAGGFGCFPAAGGVISGTWQRVHLFSNHSTFSSTSHSGHLLSRIHGTADDFSATVTFSVLGYNSIAVIGNMGTQHSSGIDLQQQ
ncbi:MAG TPA: hypothetical protein VJP04_07485 [Terriglobales bacterium]|nr:hypothetical protein [Terriglobales bacterium]